MNHMNKINWHNIRMGGGLIALGLIGAIQALHGHFTGSVTLDTAVPFLLAFEHWANGNTNS